MKKLNQLHFSFGPSLSAQHQAFFRQNGILHFKHFVSKETVCLFLQEIEKVQYYFISNDIQKVNGIPLLYGKDVNEEPLIQRMAFASCSSEMLSSFLKDPRLNSILQLLSPYEGRIAEDEKDGLVVNHYVNTRTSSFTKLGWHTDCPRDLFAGHRILPMLNVGLHLDDCPYHNGGLRVLPGTHHQGLFRLLFRKKYFIDNHPDENEVGFDIEAGDLTIHDGRLWHRVQQSPYEGEKSRRRVMYIPIITGAYKPKHARSATPFYLRLFRLKNRLLRRCF
ncbi:MAG: phytanoyl-CoA dioxygenase family protein [Flavisolibacter sp.]|nr:phytanoyl-CoA dioxygenase family protein [Flavisolibacter sp.]